MKAQNVYIGGWFQRTTLHLSEVYDFLKEADSPLDLDKQKLKALREALYVTEVTFEVGDLDRIVLNNASGIRIYLYEDGLILLSKETSSDTKEDIEKVTAYYENQLSNAISYIFSLGAPVPKELADIKTIYPYFIVLKNASEEHITTFLKEFGQEEHFAIKKDTFEIYRGNKLYIINSKGVKAPYIEKFIEEQIFIREFKGQMHRYLNIHRTVWEKIADVKERGKIKGTDIGAFKGKIEGYSKTINLIEARMNQMGVYINTRASIVKNNPELAEFIDVLEFKHETLSDTLAYLKQIWSMTKNYVNSALDLFSDLQAKSTQSSVENLTVVTSVGVAGTLIGLFTQSELPDFTAFGLVYFAILVFIGYSANRLMKYIAVKRTYSISDTEIDTKIR